MAEPASMKIDLPGVDFGALARQAIAEKLTEALVGADDAIRKVVVAALEQKVSENGQRSQYQHDNKIPVVEWLAHDLIRSATMAVLKTKLEHLRPDIEKAVEAALKASIRPAAKALTETFIRSAGASYSVGVEVKFTDRGR